MNTPSTRPILSRTSALACAILAAAACNPKSDETVEMGTTAPATTSGNNTTGAVDPTTTSTGPASTSGTSTGTTLAETTDSTGDAPAACDLWQQDCPEGQKCVPYGTNGGNYNDVKCVPLDPQPLQPGEPCLQTFNSVDQCDEGSSCFGYDEQTGLGTCIAMCMGSPDAPTCAAPDAVCDTLSDVVSLCLPTCNPLNLDDCPPGDLCVPAGDQGFVCLFNVVFDGEGGLNMPCAGINNCQPGFVCLDASAASECDQTYDPPWCCIPVCDLSDPMCTNQGAECTPWFGRDTPLPGLENVGACILPM